MRARRQANLEFLKSCDLEKQGNRRAHRPYQ
ncbi:hypothetical protein ACI3MZ_07310 (plasmid) [Escherichia coli]